MNRLIPLVLLLLIALPLEAAQFTLKWRDNSANEKGFVIERCATLTPNASTVWEAIASVGPNVVVFVDDMLPINTPYSYRLYAWNEAGFSAYSNTASGTTSTVPQTIVIPNAPTGLEAAPDKPFQPPAIPST